MTDKEEYLRGDIVLADLPPAVGSVQSGTRPVLIIQNNQGNIHGQTLIVAPLTTRLKKKYQPTHCILYGTPGLHKPSMVLLEQIMTIDKSQVHHYIATISPFQRKRVDQAIQCSIGP